MYTATWVYFLLICMSECWLYGVAVWSNVVATLLVCVPPTPSAPTQATLQNRLVQSLQQRHQQRVRGFRQRNRSMPILISYQSDATSYLTTFRKRLQREG